MEENQHDDTSTKNTEPEEEKVHDLDVPEEDAENVKGGIPSPHMRPDQ